MKTYVVLLTFDRTIIGSGKKLWKKHDTFRENVLIKWGLIDIKESAIQRYA